jgi:DTW domain-containing protein YfiP
MVAARERCLRCRRPRAACYCSALPRIDTRTRIVFLQHPRERDVAIGTARMASLCLPQASLHVGVRWDDASVFAADPDRPPILLYPSKGARDVLREPPPGPVTLVVVDGTWSQARTVVRDNPLLQALPRYAFVAPEPSQYRIRREPCDGYVSTIEAVMHVLGALEGTPARFRALLEPLRAMVDFQLACQQRSPRRQMRQVRRRVRDRSNPLAARFVDLVAVVGEANAWPYDRWKSPTGDDRWKSDDSCKPPTGDADTPRRPDELVHWVAERVATGERFEAIAAPTAALSPSTPFHTELTEAQLRAGGTRDELVAGFARFVRRSDICCAWGCYAFELMRGTAPGGAAVLPTELIDLRAHVKQTAGSRVGSLEEYAAGLGGQIPLECDAGRANRRLDLLVAAIRRLHADAEA